MTQAIEHTEIIKETPIVYIEDTACMQDAKGSYTPVDLVRERDKLEDQLVRGAVADFCALQQQIEALKKKTTADIQTFRELCAERYGVHLGGKKGNMQFYTYDGKYRISLSVSDLLRFNSDIEVAETLIRECMQVWMQGSRPEAVAIIDRALRKDKEGNYSLPAILELRTLPIEDEKWRKAMEIIGESLRIVTTKDYVRVHKRGTDGGWEHISLNMAAL